MAGWALLALTACAHRTATQTDDVAAADPQRARIVFTAYLAAFTLLVVPVVLAGLGADRVNQVARPATTDPAQALSDGGDIVLSGGGAKGIAHIGVLRALDSLGARPDLIVGTSMGAIVGGLYATVIFLVAVAREHFGQAAPTASPLSRSVRRKLPSPASR